jgi:penicillin-binding protein 1A
VFAQVGIKVGTRKVADLAQRMGIRTKVSHNYAMTLGGLKRGLTPLDMAHAYETFASGGDLIYGSLSPGADNGRDQTAPGPVGIERISSRQDGKAKPIDLPDGEPAVNRKQRRNVLEHSVATEVGSLLQSVVRDGTGTRAQVAGTVIAGKTGTTEGYGDAWFVGWSPQYTVAVWVGYPNEFKSMKTEYNGQPVAGGTYPAGIFQTFMGSALRIHPPKTDEEDPTASPTPAAPATGTAPAPTAAPTTAPDTGGTTPPASTPVPPAQTPVPTAPPAPTAAPGGDEAPDSTGQR